MQICLASGKYSASQRANEPPPKPICRMFCGTSSANSIQLIIARLYDSTSSLGLWMFIELWMVGVPRCRERMLPSSEMLASGSVWRKKRERRNGWVMFNLARIKRVEAA